MARIPLANFGQERLFLFVVDVDKGRPLRRVPVYAEAVIDLRNQDDESNGGHILWVRGSPGLQRLQASNPLVFEAVLKALEKRVNPGWIDQHGGQSKFDKLSNSLLDKLESGNLFSARHPPPNFHAMIATAIDEVAYEDDIPGPTSTDGLVYTIPLGCLASDHVGFVSFDLGRVRLDLRRIKPDNANNSIALFRRDLGADGEVIDRQGRIALYAYHNVMDQNKVDLLSSASIGSQVLVSRLALSSEQAKVQLALALPAMQSPSILEWRFSPGSFAAVPQTLIGTDGCESFTPANFAIQTFPLRQIQRLVGGDNISAIDPEYPPALAVEYKVSVTPIGHSLGQVVYSLPLAPGESVRLAIVDWKRTDSGVREEDTKFDETLQHVQARDRAITETVDAALDEWQRGGSVMGGMAAGAGGAGSFGSYGAAAGGMASLGGAYTTSSGSRDISVETAQKIGDSIQQASSATRELQSTVVIQTDQKENENLQTRFFSNNNRGHTMTVLYYEMLRHYLVKVEFVRFVEAVLVNRQKFGWISPSWSLDTDAFILAKRYILQPRLLDATLAPAFDALVRLQEINQQQQLNPPNTPNEGDIVFNQFVLDFGLTVSDNSTIECHIPLYGQPDIILRWADSGATNMNDSSVGNWFNQTNTWFTLTSLRIDPGVKWKDLEKLRFRCVASAGKIEVKNWRAIGVFDNGDSKGHRTLVADPGPKLRWDNTGDLQDAPVIPPPPPPPPVPVPAQKLSPPDYNLVQMLKDHLKFERDYYYRLLDFAVPPFSYASEFDKINVAGSRLSNMVAPYPLEILGDSVVFRRLPSAETTSNLEAIKEIYEIGGPIDPEERLVSLPTRGLFAEAKLGHCNVAEEIDDTRFWKWEEHPLPNTAPDIGPLQAIMPQNNPPKLDASNLPAPLVSIQQPPAEPDPQGMAAVLKAITTPDIFRNMSGIQQVQAMLHDLTQAAVSMAQAAAKTLDNAQKSSNQESAQGLAHEENMARIANDNQRQTANQTTPAEAQHAINLADNQVQQGKIDSATRNGIVKNQLGNVKGSAPPPAPKPPMDPLRSRQLDVTVRDADNKPVAGRYTVDLYQAGQRVNTEPAQGIVEEWQDGHRILPYKPINTRPLFTISIEGDISEESHRGLRVRGSFLPPFELPAESFEKYDFNHLSLQLNTDPPISIKAKSTDEVAKKLALTGKLDGTVGVSAEPSDEAALIGWVLKRIAKMKINATGTAGGTIEWTPLDEKWSSSTETEMTVLYYNGGVSIKGVQ